MKDVKRVRIYLSKTEKQMLRRQARNHGLTVPAYIRDLIRRKEEILRGR